jgi:signal transduction histidine kinase
MSICQRARTLHEGIEEVRQTLRDEHFPYEAGLSVYQALHQALHVMDIQAETFLKWSTQFPNDALDAAQMNHLGMLELTLKTIKEALG